MSADRSGGRIRFKAGFLGRGVLLLLASSVAREPAAVNNGRARPLVAALQAM